MALPYELHNAMVRLGFRRKVSLVLSKYAKQKPENEVDERLYNDAILVGK